MNFATLHMQLPMDSKKLREGWQRISPAFFAGITAYSPTPPFAKLWHTEEAEKAGARPTF